jgi:hypothetical protein
MRRTEYLINDARLSTNMQDTEAITNYLCTHFLNKSQDFIQALLFTTNNESKIFRGEVVFTTTSGIDTYQLPFDVYAKNSINNVSYLTESGQSKYYSRIAAVSEKNRGSSYGYFTSENKIIFSPVPAGTEKISISYNKKLPSIGIRYGKILTVNTNTSIVLEPGYTTLTGVDDFFSIVDSDGTIIKCGIEVDQATNTLTMTDTTNVLVGHYVVPGKYATTHCRLPDECESAMIMSLQKLILARHSGADLPVEKTFSDEFLQMMSNLFSENDGDDFHPPVTEYTEWF